MKNSENTIVAFHIGRGGNFNNPGFLSFIGEKTIGKFTDDLFCSFENETEFKNRFGFDSTGDKDQICILDLIADRNFDELEEKFGITEEMLGEEIYFDGGGNSTGLTASDVESGIGKINIDNDYDTTYTIFLKDADENEIFAMKKATGYKGSSVESFLEELEKEEEKENNSDMISNWYLSNFTTFEEINSKAWQNILMYLTKIDGLNLFQRSLLLFLHLFLFQM